LDKFVLGVMRQAPSQPLSDLNLCIKLNRSPEGQN